MLLSWRQESMLQARVIGHNTLAHWSKGPASSARALIFGDVKSLSLCHFVKPLAARSDILAILKHQGARQSHLRRTSGRRWDPSRTVPRSLHVTGGLRWMCRPLYAFLIADVSLANTPKNKKHKQPLKTLSALITLNNNKTPCAGPVAGDAEQHLYQALHLPAGWGPLCPGSFL